MATKNKNKCKKVKNKTEFRANFWANPIVGACELRYKNKTKIYFKCLRVGEFRTNI